MDSDNNLDHLGIVVSHDPNPKHDKPFLMEIYLDALNSSVEFYSRIYHAFYDTLTLSYTKTGKDLEEIGNEIVPSKDELVINYDEQQDLYRKSEKIILSYIRKEFDTRFRDKNFINSLSEFVDYFCELAKITGLGLMYQHLSNMSAVWNNLYVEPVRDVLYRTPSHKIHSEKNYSSFHYYLPETNNAIQIKFKSEITELGKNINLAQKVGPNIYYRPDSTPLLIIHAFINRNYILDLLPNSSIVKNFQEQGFDVYTTDWGTPSPYDKNLTLGNYVNNYLTDALDHIIEHSNSDKVSILGYCWGGDLALMLAALHPEKIKNIVTFATPGDFDVANNLLSIWTRNINANSIVDTFGNTPELFINGSFLLRSPIDVLHKYHLP